MRCFGRTSFKNRCKVTNSKWFYPFCKHHWWHPIVLIFITVPAIISSYQGIYQGAKEIIPTSKEIHLPNIKDVRVAKDLNRASWEFVIFIGQIFDNKDKNNSDEIVKLFRESAKRDSIDSLTLRRIILPKFNAEILLSNSGISINHRPVSWAEYLIFQLDEIIKKCDEILSRYAERDEGLIETVHLVQEESSIIKNSTTLSLIRLSEEKNKIYRRLIKEIFIPKIWMENYIQTIYKSRKKCYEFYNEN